VARPPWQSPSHRRAGVREGSQAGQGAGLAKETGEKREERSPFSPFLKPTLGDVSVISDTFQK